MLRKFFKRSSSDGPLAIRDAGEDARSASASYGKIEQDISRAGAELGFPHPYLAIESLTGQEEVWFFNESLQSVSDEFVRGGGV